MVEGAPTEKSRVDRSITAETEGQKEFKQMESRREQIRREFARLEQLRITSEQMFEFTERAQASNPDSEVSKLSRKAIGLLLDNMHRYLDGDYPDYPLTSSDFTDLKGDLRKATAIGDALRAIDERVAAAQRQLEHKPADEDSQRTINLAPTWKRYWQQIHDDLVAMDIHAIEDLETFFPRTPEEIAEARIAELKRTDG